MALLSAQKRTYAMMKTTPTMLSELETVSNTRITSAELSAVPPEVLLSSRARLDSIAFSVGQS